MKMVERRIVERNGSERGRKERLWKGGWKCGEVAELREEERKDGAIERGKAERWRESGRRKGKMVERRMGERNAFDVFYPDGQQD